MNVCLRLLHKSEINLDDEKRGRLSAIQATKEETMLIEIRGPRKTDDKVTTVIRPISENGGLFVITVVRVGAYTKYQKRSCPVVRRTCYATIDMADLSTSIPTRGVKGGSVDDFRAGVIGRRLSGSKKCLLWLTGYKSY